MGEKDHFNINLEDEVVRGAIVLKDGQLLWPAPPVAVSAQPQAQAVCKNNRFINSYREISSSTTLSHNRRPQR